jgi:response regulator RpfG family c-di-GMP phosphodiesterase
MAVTPLTLVVDDDRVVLHTIQEQLARNYRVVALSRVGPALDQLARESFAVVLADQFMPEMPGLEFLRRCRDLQPLCTRIVLTGLTSLPGIQEALDKEIIYRFVVKPWNRLDLLMAVRQGAERCRSLQELTTLTRENKRQREDLAALIARLRPATSLPGPERGGSVDLFELDAAQEASRRANLLKSLLTSIRQTVDELLSDPDLNQSKDALASRLERIRKDAQTADGLLEITPELLPAHNRFSSGKE